MLVSCDVQKSQKGDPTLLMKRQLEEKERALQEGKRLCLQVKAHLFGGIIYLGNGILLNIFESPPQDLESIRCSDLNIKWKRLFSYYQI